jgi:hypothetical protein
MGNRDLKQMSSTWGAAHTAITLLLGAVVMALCCYSFYLFRTNFYRDRDFAEAMKTIRAASEIVTTIAQTGLPSLRTKVAELETRGKILEQQAASLSGTTVTATEVSEGEDVLAARRKARMTK